MAKATDEFTKDSVLELSLACCEVARILKEAYEDGLDTIIIPSRGAYPFSLGMLHAVEVYAEEKGEDYEHLYNNIILPEFMKNEKRKEIRRKSKDRELRIVPYPLTADVSLPQDIRDKYCITLDDMTDSIRKYGAEVISTFTLEENERNKNDKFTFLTFLLEEVERRKDDADFYRKLKPAEYLLILDTVISGRALSTLINNLSQYDVKFRTVGIVDRNGAKLKPNYREVLNSRGAELIEVERILSEDRGAALLGIIGCIYPTIALEAERELGIRPCGAVTWHPILPKNNENKKFTPDLKERFNIYKEVFDNFREAIYDGISLLLRKSCPEDAELKIEEKIRKIVDKIENYKLLNHQVEILDPYAFVNPTIDVPRDGIVESSSHVIHIYPKKESIKGLLDKYPTYKMRRR